MFKINQEVYRINDKQIGRILDILNDVVLFLPYNSGKAELQSINNLILDEK